MTCKEAVEIEAQKIIDYIDVYNSTDISERLVNLKVYMLACVNGFSETETSKIDEDYWNEMSL